MRTCPAPSTPGARLAVLAVGATLSAGVVGTADAAAPQGQRAPAAFTLQLLSRAKTVRVGTPVRLGIAVTSADGKAHTKVRLCVTLPKNLRLVRALHGGRRTGRHTACWRSRRVSASKTATILDFRVRPTKAGRRSTVKAELRSPEVGTSTASWKFEVKR